LELTAGGGGADVSVKVRVKEGYHINANPPTFAYLKATEISVEPGEGVTAGKPVYPSSVNRSFAFAEKPLAVYEGDTEIKLPLKAAASAAKGTRTLPLRLRVQACDEKACYPPGTLDIPVGLTIK
jgi:thiol:disulfide interchange protein DsbD